jgi:hypothetical protein
MSFLINTSTDFTDYVDYEKILIYSVAEMNKLYAQKYNFYETCLNCIGVQYIDEQIQNDYLEIDHISAILEKGWAKCDSLVAWFIAVKELQGYECAPVIVHNGNYSFHVKMKYRPANTSDRMWKQIDPSDIIKKDCTSCQIHE